MLILALAIYCCFFLTFTFGEYDPREIYAKFEGDAVYFTSVIHPRVNNWKILIQEAHNKFKFKPGTIYFNLWDTAESKISKGFYYQAYNSSDIELFDKVTGPDWTSVSFPQANIDDFTYATYFIMEASRRIPTNNRVGWNGDVHSSEHAPEDKTRPMLLEFTANYSHLFHFRHVYQYNPQGHVALSDLVGEHAYLLDIGGNGYSGRLKYLMYSNRPILYVERNYVEWFNHLLKPYVHYIPVKQDLSDLVKQTEWAMNNSEKAAEIAGNALEFAIENLNYDAFIDKVGEVVNYLLEDGH